MSEIYEKWRELNIEPSEIEYKNIKIERIISYPPAGNDVVECIARVNEKSENVFIKIERSKVCDFESEVKHLNYLRDNNYYTKLNIVYENGSFKGKKYIVLSKIEGERLSNILSKSKKKSNSKTNIKDTIKSAKGTILNNRKICTINSIKNMFVTTNSMINNYLLYNNNHTNKNSSTRKIYSINQGKNVIENRKISINKSQGQNSKRRMNSQSVLSRAETTRYSINQKV